MAETMTLWRAAKDDSIGDTASFAATREHAEAYLTNPGFGGPVLYRAEVEVEPGAVLRLTDERDPVAALVDLTGLDHPGNTGADEWICMSVAVADALRERGIEWVVLLDSYPEGCETWTWIGPWEREPEMEEAE